MKTVDIEYINYNLVKRGCPKITLVKDTYPEIKVNKEGTSLIDDNGNNIGTKGDMYQKLILDRILQEGCLDDNPRPHWLDGTPAHSLSVNHGMTTYDLSKGEFPVTTLRPTAVKSGIGEILWIYQDNSNDLDILRDKYNVTWWDEWDIGNRTIGATYGETIRRRDMVRTELEGLRNDPDGRRHIINMWQIDDYKEPHGLKPCAFMTIWNVRHERNGIDYLDMELVQRSSDFITAGFINQSQYTALLYMFAQDLGLKPGRFSWNYDNIQIYDRHINDAIEVLNREPINCSPYYELNPNIKNFFEFTKGDIKLMGYPKKEIEEKNKQLKLEIAI